MSERVEELLSEVVARLKEGYQPERIILFGSYAYGTPSEDSDVDLLVVKNTEETPSQRWARVKDLLKEANRRIAITPLVYTPQELAARLKVGDFFIEEILTKGKTLYG